MRHIVTRIIAGAVADHNVNEHAIRQSRLDWTIVHAPRLTLGKRTGQYRSGEAITPTFFAPSLSRADVAEFMLRQLMDTAFVHKAPTILR